MEKATCIETVIMLTSTQNPMLDHINNSDINAQQFEEAVTPTPEVKTRVQASNASKNKTSSDISTHDKIKKMLKAGFKVNEIVKALSVSAGYVYKVKAERNTSTAIILPKEGLIVDPDAEGTERRKQEFLIALLDCHGVIYDAVGKIGVAYGTYYRWVNTDAKFKARVAEVKESTIEYVESQLIKQINQGVPQSTIFFLKTRGKNHGYTERVEITGKDGDALAVRVIEPYVDTLADMEDDDEGVIDVDED